ncbi:MAG: hypothetical protein EBX72_07295, partial [Betaproteobacteria bacterium]|nr:hypothetical protein [Betaproteobacteria bacterium]
MFAPERRLTQDEAVTSFILTTAMLHIVNHMSLPVSWFKSYSMYSGATDAMVQWFLHRGVRIHD